MNDIFEDEEPEFLDDTIELKKEIARLKRQLTKEQKYHDQDMQALRAQIGDLLEKNMALTEANNIFARGLDALRRENNKIVTETTYWHRGGKDLDKRIQEIVGLGKRIVAVCPLETSPHGQITGALIITEHFDKNKSAIAPKGPFRE